jgi:farnesyl diphosphate synthase
MGAIVANLDLEVQEKLYQFGLDIGLLFQIQDDIIDETQSEEEAGKTTSNDGAKNSFVNLLGLDGSIKSADKLAKECEQTLKKGLEEPIVKYLYRHR